MDKNNNTGVDNSGNRNSGNWNSGNRNSGYRNSGDGNSGYRNSGDWNSGRWNSGDWNSGYRNSGDGNSGDWNSGYRNSGYRNSGDWNSGDWNSGRWNSGDWNSGIFNTNEPKMRSFNKDSEYTYTEFRNKFGYGEFDLPICSWIDPEDMTAKEKKAVKGWSEMGGYLKTLGYKEAWKKGWSEATQEQKDWYKSFPNFDAKIFEEITGINIEDSSLSGKKVKVELDGKSYTATID